jgi:23S rRNA pseudouridine955/2504/2580 synthase
MGRAIWARRLALFWCDSGFTRTPLHHNHQPKRCLRGASDVAHQKTVWPPPLSSASNPNRGALQSLRGPRPVAPDGQCGIQLLTVDAESAGQRLDNVLRRVLKGVPKSHVYRIIRSGEVRLNKGRASAHSRLAEGDVLRVPPMRVPTTTAVVVAPASSDADGELLPKDSTTPQVHKFPVLLEDEYLLAIDKPAGVAVHGGSGQGLGGGVIEQLRRARPDLPYLELVHRLDKDTSGVLLLAKKRATLNALHDQFHDGTTGKVYAALVFGDWAHSSVIDRPLVKTPASHAGGRGAGRSADRGAGRAGSGGAASGTVRLAAGGGNNSGSISSERGARRAVSLVTARQRFRAAGMTLLDVTLTTGRKHQIRVHLASEGHPVVGDPKYGDERRNLAVARGGGGGKTATSGFGRMLLHARALAFDHPAHGHRVELTSPLPDECRAFLAALAAEDGAAAKEPSRCRVYSRVDG